MQRNSVRVDVRHGAFDAQQVAAFRRHFEKFAAGSRHQHIGGIRRRFRAAGRQKTRVDDVRKQKRFSPFPGEPY